MEGGPKTCIATSSSPRRAVYAWCAKTSNARRLGSTRRGKPCLCFQACADCSDWLRAPCDERGHSRDPRSPRRLVGRLAGLPRRVKARRATRGCNVCLICQSWSVASMPQRTAVQSSSSNIIMLSTFGRKWEQRQRLPVPRGQDPDRDVEAEKDVFCAQTCAKIKL
jgi:hypothetical protein